MVKFASILVASAILLLPMATVESRSLRGYYQVESKRSSEARSKASEAISELAAAGVLPTVATQPPPSSKTGEMPKVGDVENSKKFKSRSKNSKASKHTARGPPSWSATAPPDAAKRGKTGKRSKSESNAMPKTNESPRRGKLTRISSKSTRRSSEERRKTEKKIKSNGNESTKTSKSMRIRSKAFKDLSSFSFPGHLLDDADE